MSGPVSGGHFNPVVSFVDAVFGGIGRRDALAYLPVQVGGCILGAILANAMFAKAAISISTHHRASPAHLSAEIVATLGLLLVIFSLAAPAAAPPPRTVGACIGAAYWFTSSTSFANPAINDRPDLLQHLRRHCFGISPAFILAQTAPPASASSGSGASTRTSPQPTRPTSCCPTPAATIDRRRRSPPSTTERHDEHRPVRVPAQRRPLPDQPGAVRTRRQRSAHRALGRHHPRRPHSPRSREVMRELAIDLSDRKPQPLTRELAEQADTIITMGCGDQCPYIPGKRYLDWDLPDPKSRPINEVRATRDDIEQRVHELVHELENTPTA